LLEAAIMITWLGCQKISLCP